MPSARTEIDELYFERLQVDENILVFDVTMQHAAGLHSDHGLDDLSEQVTRQRMIERSLVVYKVPQVDGSIRPLHYDKITIEALDKVKYANASLAVGHRVHQIDFHRDLFRQSQRVDTGGAFFVLSYWK